MGETDGASRTQLGSEGLQTAVQPSAQSSALNPVQWYLLGTGSWFVFFGIQSVLFAWLVVIYLHEPPEHVGLAQMAMLLPSMFLLLIGGGLADHFGHRRVVMLAQGFAIVPSVVLAAIVLADRLSFPVMIGYAVLTGIAQAFVTPARDGMLSQVGAGRIQQTVLTVSFVQYGVQLCGFALAAVTEWFGAAAVLLCQAAILGGGVWSFSRLPLPPPVSQGYSIRNMLRLIGEGRRTVMASAPMRAVLFVNCATALCFMASYIVSIPLLIREAYGGSSLDLSLVNAANVLGLMTTIVWLMRRGGLQRKGRALLLAHGAGALALGSLGAGLPFAGVLLAVFLWGACGGIAMSMARTIMQELAPDGAQGRVMSFFSLSFLGTGPFGALLAGYLNKGLGPSGALAASSLAMFVLLAVVARMSALWRLDAANPAS